MNNELKPSFSEKNSENHLENSFAKICSNFNSILLNASPLFACFSWISTSFFCHSK